MVHLMRFNLSILHLHYLASKPLLFSAFYTKVWPACQCVWFAWF